MNIELKLRNRIWNLEKTIRTSIEVLEGEPFTPPVSKESCAAMAIKEYLIKGLRGENVE